MKIPLNWLAEYVKLPKNQIQLTDKLTLAGHMLDKIQKAPDGSTVLDLELRGNRADCYSLLGIAREVSALFETPIKYPEIATHIKRAAKLQNFTLDVKTNLVKRVMMAEIQNVKITSSPKWLKDKIEAYGLDSINNIVDLTNYVMLESGEPMHAFDLDKVGRRLHIRLAKAKEKMTTFQGKTLTLTGEELVWANNDSVLSVAAAIGEKYHSISPTTKNILVEAASYERSNIRRSIHKLNLLTEAGIRHEKELDPNLVDWAIFRFLKLIEENNWGKIVPLVSDYYPKPLKPWKIILNLEYLHSLGAIQIDQKELANILTRLNFKLETKNAHQLEVLIPTYRTDVVLEEDLIEEIVRIYGYEKIVGRSLALEIPKNVTPKYITQEDDVKNALVALGFNEVISSSFVNSSNLKHNQSFNKDKYEVVKVQNRPSPDLENMRMSLLPNLLEFTTRTINERSEAVRLFEVGKIYLKEKGGYIEKRKLGIIFYKKDTTTLSDFMGYIEAIFEKLKLENPIRKTSDLNMTSVTKTYEIKLEKEIVGYGGQLQNIYYVEIDLDKILGKDKSLKVTLWPSHPPQIEDITISLPERTFIGDVIQSIKKIDKQIVDVKLTDIYKDAHTFRIWYQNPNKTLNNKEVEKIRTKILKVFTK